MLQNFPVVLILNYGYHYFQGCQPYSLPSCNHHVKGKRKNCYSFKNITVPQCKTTCSNINYAVPFNKDFYHGMSMAFKSQTPYRSLVVLPT